MKTFVPFEDDWAALKRQEDVRLVPYQAGMTCVHLAARHSSLHGEPSGVRRELIGVSGGKSCTQAKKSGESPSHRRDSAI